MIHTQTQLHNTCVAFGRFDGMHLGHAAVLKTLVAAAKARGLNPVLVSFEPLEEEKILTTADEKNYVIEHYILKDTPLHTVISMPQLPLDQVFFKQVLSHMLDTRAVVVGACKENLPAIRQWCSACGIEVVECDTAQLQGEVINSRRVARAVQEKDFDAARALLGHPYFFLGEVVAGKRLGRTVGWPTANIDFPQNKLLPPEGVYVTMTQVEQVRRAGVSNIGRRPSVDDFDYITIENHIIDFSGDLYGKVLPVELYRFIRGVKKFDSLEGVRAQIDKDVASIRDYVKTLV